MRGASVFLSCLLVLVAFAQGCTCENGATLSPPTVIACKPQHSSLPGARAVGPARTVAATLSASFSLTDTGEAAISIPLTAPRGRGGIEPALSVASSSAAGDNVMGVGFSLVGTSAVTRCAKTTAIDGEIRAVRFDASDTAFCLDGRRLVKVAEKGATVEYRTLPDAHIRVLGHFKGEEPASFEAHLPSGHVVAYGEDAGSRPRARGGTTRAWLSSSKRDLRGNTMTYGYCFAEADGYTAEYALDEIRYTSFDGASEFPATRAISLVYGTRDARDVRLHHAGGMRLQRSLRLDEVQMRGPGDTLVRRYAFTYDASETTGRTRLIEMKECGADDACTETTRFLYPARERGFDEVDTGIAAPTSLRASPLLLDADGDGLDDLLVPDTSALSTPQNPITEWRITRNEAGTLGAPKLAYSQEWPLVPDPPEPADPSRIQPEPGTPIDYDQDGRADVLLHDVRGWNDNHIVLRSKGDGTFEEVDTGIPRPFPLGATPHGLRSSGGSVHLGDVDGDGVPDLIQCEDHGGLPDPTLSSWRLHLWRPGGFEPTSSPITLLDGVGCGVELHLVDIDADDKVELVTPGLRIFGGDEAVQLATYTAFARASNGTWTSVDTKLPLAPVGGRVMFLDVNGDRLPDAVMGGFSDTRLYTRLNTGRGFDAPPVHGLAWDGVFPQDSYFRLATPLDFDGDGRMDLLLPLRAGAGILPKWTVLRAASGEFTFESVDSGIPFEAELGDAITLADPRGPRIGDVNGDGASDVLIFLGSELRVFRNEAVDPDRVVGFSDGVNVDPPNVEFAYGHMIADPDHYDPRADPANACAYPRVCAVGARRVVTSYATIDGNGGQRHFDVRYEDGRYDRRGHGFLGFSARVVTERETGAETTDLYDNHTYLESGEVKAYPFAGQALGRHLRFSSLDPAKDEVSRVDVTPTHLITENGRSYFTLPLTRRTQRRQGATLLRDTKTEVLDFDAFGNVLEVRQSTLGVDLSLHTTRVVENDTQRWVLGQVQSQKECSAAAGISQCRSRSQTTNTFGEVETASLSTDDGGLDTSLTVKYERDELGHVTTVTADDAFGHHRVWRTAFDAEGIFPEQTTNPAGHVTRSKYDSRFGVPIRETDPNGLVTEWSYDSLGRWRHEKRPDGSETWMELSRRADGHFVKTSRTTGGAEDEVVLDGLGRPIRHFWYGPEPIEGEGKPPRLMQILEYDDRTGKVRRRSVPTSEGTPDAELLFDEYEFDLLGREIGHTAPWGAVTKTTYAGLFVEVQGALSHLTVTEHDALGRPVVVTDAGNGETSFTYGPFGVLSSVVDPGGDVTTIKRDALGRPREIDDPDRGKTKLVQDGFGDLLSTTDALGRVTTFEVDALGRVTSRVDKEGGATWTTLFTWDTAAYGMGRLREVTSPDGVKTYTYDDRGRTERMALLVGGEAFEVRSSYDALGRVSSISYPGVEPFSVTYTYDAHGHRVAVRDTFTGAAYWRLTEVDEAGRVQKEVFGNEVVTTRSYFQDKQALHHVRTTFGATKIQDLSYEFDARLNLTSRTDALQAQNETERFRYDALERLTCASFSVSPDPAAPCDSSYAYAPNGNLLSRSGVGAYVYGDSLHPHAVTSAGGAGYSYDAVGNQVARPGATVTYTPFDLPRTITMGAGTTTFGYDGDEARIRKTTPTKETLYVGDLYERIEDKATGVVEHRYSVHSSERVVAVVTRGGAEAGTHYLHVDHLGSIESVTDEEGSQVEKRSYDPFGQRRNVIWGLPPPAPPTSKATTRGFTGPEGDDELGLVNMKGRMFDPRLGRFLTTDPVIADVFDGQSHNRYSYVVNNPLSLVDPTGFSPVGGVVHQPGYPDVPLSEDHIRPSPWFLAGQEVRRLLAHEIDPPGVGAGAAATDVETTGSTSAARVDLPTVEIPHPSGPGTDDPFGVYSPDVMLDSSAIPLFDQLLAGSPSAGRTAFVVQEEDGFARDLSILFGPEREVILLRPQIGDPVLRDPREQAAGRLVFEGTLMLGAVLTPGPEDDIALLGSRALRRGSNAAGGGARVGEFSVIDWSGYPTGAAKPTGPFRLLEGAEYQAAREAANKANVALRAADPARYAGKQIHEIHPVKFGGSPTAPANKVALTPSEHAKYTTFWNRLMRDIQ
ncbi:FG-GAP-like repeat-containing protein [Polyangium sorediatum]|uniref:FG-GAP-like repeat-containing protein n=1 Tax=Polyangium sorediatum TaxID=889274 RepID=A0ABT6NWY0_9BACT|nr:FG-GAP-like repeat-containing protein [Polyangium sorediatum]MDI1432847.1 FG-GAP-like repeat-containing protein [Polyangium sorediatum]